MQVQSRSMVKMYSGYMRNYKMVLSGKAHKSLLEAIAGVVVAANYKEWHWGNVYNN